MRLFVEKYLNRFSKYHLFYGLFLAFFGYLLFLQLSKPLGWDELEHLHSTYLVAQGKHPYTDFFQHHHPALWYLFAPIFLVWGESSMSLWIIKLISIAIGFFNLYLIYRISKYFIENHFFQMLVPVLISASVFFLFNGMEFRPDNLMISFVLLSFTYLLKFIDKLKESGFCMRSDLIFSGLLLGLGIVFLQKAILFIPIYGLILFFNLVADLRLRHLFRELFIFTALTLVPLLSLFLLYYMTGDFASYYFLNWTLNTNFQDKFSPIVTLTELLSWYEIGLFLVFLVVMIYAGLKYSLNKSNFKIVTLILLNLYLLFTLFTLVRSPYFQYFLPITFFGAILVVKINEEVYWKISKNLWLVIFAVLLVFSLLPLFTFKSSYLGADNRLTAQIEAVSHIRALPEPIKRGLTVQRDRNIYFTVHGYYWYSPEAIQTIRTLDERGKVPSSIPRP